MVKDDPPPHSILAAPLPTLQAPPRCQLPPPLPVQNPLPPPLASPLHLALDLITVRSFLDETLPQDGAKTTHFCSMKISGDVRQYAAEQTISEEEATQKGMNEKSKEFTEAGAEVCMPA